MDSKGHVIVMEDDRVVSRSEKPMPNPARGHLVLAALDAGHKAAPVFIRAVKRMREGR